MPLFSDRAAEGKLQKLFGCMRSQQLHAHAAKGSLSRLPRKHGYYAVSGHALVVHSLPPHRHGRKLFCDGPTEWLALHGMHICRHNMPGTAAGLSGLLLQLVPLVNTAHRQVCISQHMYTVGDLVELRRGEAHWYALGPLVDLLPYLSAVVPNEQQPLRVGQCWKLANRHGGCDDMAVVAWYRVALGGKKRGLLDSGSQYLFPRSSASRPTLAVNFPTVLARFSPSPTAARSLHRDGHCFHSRHNPVGYNGS